MQLAYKVLEPSTVVLLGIVLATLSHSPGGTNAIEFCREKSVSSFASPPTNRAGWLICM